VLSLLTIHLAENKGTAIYSGRREGLALYFARLVRPIWKANITKLSPAGDYELGVPLKQVLHVQQNLFALKDFLDKNPHLFHSAAPVEQTTNRAPVADQEAWKAEATSVAELQSLLARTIEALAFMMLLNDYRLGELVVQSVYFNAIRIVR
jgi:nuclear pore complex protein Nup155